jgi:hypothetical protein
MAGMSDTLLSGVKEQAELDGMYQSGFRVGGLSVRISGFSTADVLLTPPLEPFRVKAGVSDIDIRVEWSVGFDPAPGPTLFDSGSIWRLYENRGDLQFDFTAPCFGKRPYKRLLVDRDFSRATLRMNEECFADGPGLADPLEYPLDELLITHRLTLEKGIELHGCGIIGPNGASNLFIGHSGAGKSTTSRLWAARDGVEILSDDRIILREHASQIFMYGTPWHGEAAFALPQSAPLERIFVLEHGRGNVLTRLTRSQVVGELFARSFVPFHRHEYVDSALSFLERVADTVPCYRYSFEPDERAVEKILGFRD